MKKIVIRKNGGYDRLLIENHPDPRPKEGEVLVIVKNTGVNYADICVRWGIYESANQFVGLPITPGFEFAGVVEDVGKNVSNWLDREYVYPTNVIHLATECNNKNHSAAFPEKLPEWFIKLFTKEGDTVLDPFMGSGTTNIAANRMRRNSIGIEIIHEYCEMVRRLL